MNRVERVSLAKLTTRHVQIHDLLNSIMLPTCPLSRQSIFMQPSLPAKIPQDVVLLPFFFCKYGLSQPNVPVFMDERKQ